MGCEPQSIDRRNICPNAAGGIEAFAVIEGPTIDDVTLADGVMTNITLDQGGSVTMFYPTDDDSAYSNSTGDRPNDGNNHFYAHETYGSFEGVDDDTAHAADGLADCCNLVIIAFFNNGFKLVHGIEQIKDADPLDPQWKFSQKRGKATVNVMSGTGADSSKVEIFMRSRSRNIVSTDMTIDDFEAL